MILKNKVALVTGASRGIGKAIAESFSLLGANVIGTSTNTNGVDNINSYLKSSGIGIILNVADENSVNRSMQIVNEKFGNIDILVNNAGIICDNILIRMKYENWKTVLNTNLTSVFLMSKAVIHSMIKRRYGRIINISSIIGITGNIGQTNYSASKSGLVGFSKSLAREVASRGITVNVVSPGFIKTDMTSHLLKKEYEKIKNIIPMKRFGKPKDVANVVSFLASDQSEYITGETIHVNGGIYMV